MCQEPCANQASPLAQLWTRGSWAHQPKGDWGQISHHSGFLHTVVWSQIFKINLKREKAQTSCTKGDWTSFLGEVDAAGNRTDRSSFSTGLGCRWRHVWGKILVSSQHKISCFVLRRISRACELGLTITRVWMGHFSGILSLFVTPQDAREKGKHWIEELDTLIHGVDFSRLPSKPSIFVNSL